MFKATGEYDAFFPTPSPWFPVPTTVHSIQVGSFIWRHFLGVPHWPGAGLYEEDFADPSLSEAWHTCIVP